MMWLIKGLAVTFKKFFSPKITQRYPEQYPNLSAAVRGSFNFDAQKCTSCNLCAMACPNKVINVAVTKNEEGKRILDEYQMSLAYCLYCGMCTEACPTDAISMNPKFIPAYYFKENSLVRWRGK